MTRDELIVSLAKHWTGIVLEHPPEQQAEFLGHFFSDLLNAVYPNTKGGNECLGAMWVEELQQLPPVKS